MAAARLRSGAKKSHLSVVQKPETAPENDPRVLRIGAVESGRIIDEKIVDLGKSVSIGQSERCDIVIANDDLAARYRLFEYGSNGYRLVFTDTMDGRVSLSDGFFDFDTLKRSGKAKQHGRRWRLDINEESRGKVIVGNTTLLFQMVRQPPTLPKPQLPAAVRGGWLKSIDWAFSTFVLLSFLAQFGLVLYLVNRDWPLRPTFDLTSDTRVFSTPPSFTRVDQLLKQATAPTTEEVLPAVPTLDPMATDLVPEKVRQPRRDPARGQTNTGPTAAERAAESERRVQDALQRSVDEALGRIILIGSNNQNSDTATADVLRGGRAGNDLDGVMEQITGTEIARNNQDAIMRRPESCRGTDCGHATIDDLRARIRTETGGGDLESGGVGEERAVTGTVRPGTTTTDPSDVGVLDQGVIRTTIRSHLGAIRSCYERALQRNHSLRGRVTMSFTIGGTGRVVSARSTSNLGAPEVGSCMESQFRRIRFPAPSGGPVHVRHPFVFEPSH